MGWGDCNRHLVGLRSADLFCDPALPQSPGHGQPLHQWQFSNYTLLDSAIQELDLLICLKSPALVKAHS